jgi:glycerophosphoryl diester phosphodiesterase
MSLALVFAANVGARPLIIGHRGTGADHWKNPYPENTLPSIRAGLAEGADFVEVDVQLDAEGVAILWHDKTVKFPDGEERPLTEVRREDIPDRVGPTGIVTPVPTLREALALAAELTDGPRKINLELKVAEPGLRPALVDKVVAELRRARMARQVMVTSFDPVAVGVMEAKLPGIETGLLGTASRAALDDVLYLRAAGRHVEWVLPDKRFELGEPSARGFLKLAHDAGVRVGVYTVNWSYQLRGFASLGYDAIITDVPDRAVAILP